MAAFNRVQYGLKDISRTAQVPDDPTAKLMYYLNSICTILDLDDTDSDLRVLRDYAHYFQLSAYGRTRLITLCLMLSPDTLINKCIFQSDAMCGNMANKFYELAAVRHQFFVAGNILVGGRNRRVQKIMCFKMSWLNNNYFVPLRTLTQAPARRDNTTQACTIL
jgi:hypothetical protein